MSQIKYRIFATALDSYWNYLHYESVWQKYWGFSDNPSISLEDFEQKCRQDLLDTLNKAPHEPSEPASKGTAFNELIDCLIAGKEPDFPCEVYEDSLNFWYKVKYDGFEFLFEQSVTDNLAEFFDGALSQVLVSGVIDTKYGDVEVYGYIDELMPMCIHDIKTTSSYNFPKFADHAQHLVYPFAARQNGMNIDRFEYNIVVFDRKNLCELEEEVYTWNDERDIPILRSRVEDLVSFIIDNKELITNKKLTNGI